MKVVAVVILLATSLLGRIISSTSSSSSRKTTPLTISSEHFQALTGHASAFVEKAGCSDSFGGCPTQPATRMGCRA